MKLDRETLVRLDARLQQVYGHPRPSRRPPLDELVLTILSQATTDRQRDRAYKALRRRFPSWEEVRDADAEEVEAVIAVAGLARQKAERIIAALTVLTRGERPALEQLAAMDSSEACRYLTSLPGVGPKTAACVLLFAFGKPVFPVDTHVLRLARRLGLAGRETAGRLQQQLTRLTPGQSVLPLHVNLIKHGRTVCRARRPLCGDCFLARECNYHSP